VRSAFRRLRGLAAAALLVTAGCAPSAGWTAGSRDLPDPAAGERLVVLATFTVLADMVEQVGGPHVEVASLTGPGMNVHGYEPSPDDLRRAAGADLMVANGLGLEAWLTALVEPLGLPTVVLTDGLEPLPIVGTAVQTGGLPHNPHAWMSPRAGQHYVAAIAAALAEHDPANAADYAARAAAYSAQLAEVEAELIDRLGALPPDRRVLVTCEGAFSYLAADVGLDEAFLWPVNSERQGTPRQAAAVITTVRERDVPAVFCESTVSATAQRQVARETGARFGGELYVDSLTGPEGPAATYLDMLRYDADLIIAGPTGEGS
jgi:manganese transport system substrate-binding protein